MNLWRFAKFSQYDDRKWSKVTSKVDYFWVKNVKKVLKGLFWDKNVFDKISFIRRWKKGI